MSESKPINCKVVAGNYPAIICEDGWILDHDVVKKDYFDEHGNLLHRKYTGGKGAEMYRGSV